MSLSRRSLSCLIVSTVMGLLIFPLWRAAAQTATSLPAQLWVACDGGGGIRRFDINGNLLTPDIPPGFALFDFTVGPDGNVYMVVPTSGGVVRLNPQTGLPVLVNRYNPASGAVEADDFVSQNPDLNGRMNYPVGIAFGPDGNLYVCAAGPEEGQAGRSAVYRYNGITGDFIDMPLPPGTPNLTTPGDIVLGPDGRLYIGSGVQHGGVSANAVLRYDPATNAVETFVTPQDNGGLDRPSQMAFGPDGNLYVISATTNGVKQYNGKTGAFQCDFVPGGTPTAEIDGILGTFIHTPGDGGRLINPLGLAFGPDGDLYVSCYNDIDAINSWDPSSPGAVFRYNGTTGARVGEFVTHASQTIFGAGFLCWNGGVTSASTTPVEVSPTSATTITFSQVNGAGQTTVDPLSDPNALPLGVTLPANFQIPNDTNSFAVFYDIHSTADITGASITLSFKYDQTKYTNESNVRMLHWEILKNPDGSNQTNLDGTPKFEWKDITTNVDTVSNIVYGVSSSLSPFAILEPRPRQWSGVLQPINADGSSAFKQGSTIPVKFKLTGADAGIANLTAKLYLSQVDSVDPVAVNEAVSTSAADSGNTFRYDAIAGQYIFNLSTKSLSQGTWYLRIDLGDGTTNIVKMRIKK